MKREAKEEVGLDINFVHYPVERRGNKKEFALPFYANRHTITQDHSHYCLFYLCTINSTKINASEKELKGYRWVGLDDLEKLSPSLNEGDLFTCREALKLGEELAL